MVIGFLVGLVEFCRRHALLVLLAGLVATVLCGFYAANNLGVSTDTSKLLSPDLPWQQQSAAYAKAFPQTDLQTTIVLDGTSADAVEDATTELTAALARRPDLFKTVHRPDGGPFFNRYGLMFLPADELSRLADQIAEAQPLLGPLDADPSLRGLFGVLDQALLGLEQGETTGDKLQGPMDIFAKATDGFVAGHPKAVNWGELMTGRPPRPEELRHFILVQPVLDFDALEPGQKASDEIRHLVAALHIPERGVRVRLTGEVPLQDDEFASVSEGAGTATGFTFVAVLVILLAGLRAPRLILAIIATLIAGLVFTAAFAAAAVGTLNMVSVAFAVLFIGIGVDFGIQFSMRYRAELFDVTGGAAAPDQRQANQQALVRTARSICGPLSMAALATAVGFFSFLPTDYRGVSELGLIAGTSMLIALFANLTLLPALLSVLPARGVPEEVGFAWAAPIDLWLHRHAKPVLAVAAIAALAALASAPWARFDADPLDLRDPRKESVQVAHELMRDQLTSPYSIEILRPSFTEAAALGDRLQKLPEVGMVLSLASFVPDDQQTKLDTLDQMKLFLGPLLDPNNKTTPPTPAEELVATKNFEAHLAAFLQGPKAAMLGAGGKHLADALGHFLAMPGADTTGLRQALLSGLEGRIDMLRTSLEAGPLKVETMPDEIKSDWVTADGRVRLSVYPKGDMHDPAQLKRFVAAVRAVVPDATGTPVTILESGKTVSGAFLHASLYALVAITLVLIVVLRRARDVVLVLVPLILAGLYSVASSVLFDLPFNYANVIAVPLLMGIGVAFDIYFVVAWRRGTGQVALLQSATARAVVFSAATTMTAFGSLALSHHAGTASMGLLLLIALGYVLLSTLIVQPALMTVWGRGR